MPLTRRSFLTSSATLGLSACTCSHAPPIAMRDAAALTAPSNLLAPSRINTRLRRTRSVVDAHCHIFNASDVQVAGYLAGPMANDRPVAVRELIRLLAPIVEEFAQSVAVSAYGEMEQLDELERLLRSPDSFLASTPETVLDDVIGRYRRQLANELAAEIRGSEALAAEIDRLTGQPRGFTAGDPDNLREFLLGSLTSDEQTPEPAALRGPASSRQQAGGVFTFVGHMLAPRFHNLRSHQKVYASGERAVGVELCLASLVDMDYWLGTCEDPYSLLRDQILLNERMAGMSGGYLKPLVAYNPWSDMEDDGASLALVRDAVRKRGFKGVKIYPPMGFSAHGNATDPTYPRDGRRPDLTGLDERLGNFFEECRSLDVPVMAHAAASMGQLPGHEKLAGPEGWARFFAVEENRPTRVNLAHAGGEPMSDGNWTEAFVALMKKAPRLYADLGYWDRFVAGDEEAARRLKQLLAVDVGEGETAADRLMFGTDWFMLTTQAGYQNYAVAFQEALQKRLALDDATLNKLFTGNARRLFKLNEPPPPTA